jgi:hypothetical protein
MKIKERELGKDRRVIVMKQSDAKKIWQASTKAYYETIKKPGYGDSEKAPPDDFMRKHCEI